MKRNGQKDKIKKTKNKNAKWELRHFNSKRGAFGQHVTLIREWRGREVEEEGTGGGRKWERWERWERGSGRRRERREEGMEREGRRGTGGEGEGRERWCCAVRCAVVCVCVVVCGVCGGVCGLLWKTTTSVPSSS